MVQKDQYKYIMNSYAASCMLEFQGEFIMKLRYLFLSVQRVYGYITQDKCWNGTDSIYIGVAGSKDFSYLFQNKIYIA